MEEFSFETRIREVIYEISQPTMIRRNLNQFM